MEEKLDKIDELFALFDERDRARVRYNNQIADHLTPTILMALFELFELPAEAVHWKNIDLIDNMIVVLVELYYKSTPDICEFLKMMDIASKASSDSTVRTLRVGVPVGMAFDGVENLKQYYVDMAERLTKPDKAPTKEQVEVQQTGFNPMELTKEQIAQLLLFQQTAPGEKQ